MTRGATRLALCAALSACGAPSGPACVGRDGEPIRVGTLATASSELSGLAASHTVDDLFWTHDDTGAADLYSIDANAGIHGTLHLDGASAVDWEDIATAPCSEGRCIYIADTGDNDHVRATIAIYEVAEPGSNPVGTLDVTWTRYLLRFADAPHDIEALVVDPRDGTAYGITKVENGAARVYELPRLANQVTTAAQVGTFEPPSGDARVTAADLVIDDCAARLAIRTRDRLFELRAEPNASITELLAAEPHELHVADEQQGEAIAYAEDGGAYYTVSEGPNPPLWRVDVQ